VELNQDLSESPPGSDFDSGDQAHTIRLPGTNRPAVPAELVEPIHLFNADRSIWNILRTKRVSLDLDAMPLADVASLLHSETGINFLLDRVTLQEEGVTADSPITARLKNVRLINALDRVLLNSLNLTVTVKHRVVVITSQLQAGNELTLRVYPVADLVLGDPRSRHASEFADADPLIQVIEQTVSPNSWASVGGAGSIEPFYGTLSLVVFQTDSVHDQVADLLGVLRRARAGTPPNDDPSKPRPLRPGRIATATPVLGVSEAELQIKKALSDKAISLNVAETPLCDVLSLIETISGYSMYLDKPALEEEGVTPDTPLSFKITNVPVESALNLLLEQLNLTWVVKNDVMVITSRFQAGNELYHRCYPVGDLVIVDEEEGGHEELIQIIESTVTPNSWSCVGGAGTIEFFANSRCLIVNQTRTEHDHVVELLEMLRESADRLPGLAHALGLPLTEELLETRLKSAREGFQRIELEERRSRQARAALEQQQFDDSNYLERSKLRIEAGLLTIAEAQAERLAEVRKAQLHKTQAETAAAKARADLAEAHRSAHRDGVNFLLGDGTVRFLVNWVDFESPTPGGYRGRGRR